MLSAAYPDRMAEDGAVLGRSLPGRNRTVDRALTLLVRATPAPGSRQGGRTSWKRTG